MAIAAAPWRIRLARGDRQAIALFAEDLGEGEPDPSRGSGDDGGAVGHGRTPHRMHPRTLTSSLDKPRAPRHIELPSVQLALRRERGPAMTIRESRRIHPVAARAYTLPIVREVPS